MLHLSLLPFWMPEMWSMDQANRQFFVFKAGRKPTILDTSKKYTIYQFYGNKKYSNWGYFNAF